MKSAKFTVPSFVSLTVADLDEFLVQHPTRAASARTTGPNKRSRRTVAGRGRSRPVKPVPMVTTEVQSIAIESCAVTPGTAGSATITTPPIVVAPRPIAAANASDDGGIKRTPKPIARRVAIAGSIVAIGALALLSLQLARPNMTAGWRENGHDSQMEPAPNSKPSGAFAGTAVRDSAHNSSTRTTGRIESASNELLAGEKENISKFLAQRYRTELYQTEQIVHHSFDVARELNMDPWLILAVISIESNLNPRAVSPRDARGLMQIHAPAHAGKFTPHGGIDMAFHPETNIRVGASILRGYIDRHASVQGALKAYVGAALLPDDSGYGAKVLAEQEQIAAAALGLPTCQASDRSTCKSVVKRPTRARGNDAQAERETDSRARQHIEAGAAGEINNIQFVQ